MQTIARPIEYLVSGIFSTSAIIRGFIRSLCVSHPDLATVTRELSKLRLVLDVLVVETKVPLRLQLHMLLVLESCGNVLIHVDTILKRWSEAAKWLELGRPEMPIPETKMIDKDAAEERVVSNVERLQTRRKFTANGNDEFESPKMRPREYFVRSHAMLSENFTLIAITTHFGLHLEIYNFGKGGSGEKKVQVIEEAHRWAASQRDAFHNGYAGLAVFCLEIDRIDRYFLSRHPSAKSPFHSDPNHSIELLKTDLPLVPKYSELIYSSDSPFLIAAAGPRPGDSPRTLSTILIAWHMKPISEAKLNSQAPR
ncbi:hypothetical protein N0V88_007723 [Collariella sp. IMI 366227]|nr:hypothetical protein N0V88_007723 [Collariella sp. IMI 366227]